LSNLWPKHRSLYARGSERRGIVAPRVSKGTGGEQAVNAVNAPRRESIIWTRVFNGVRACLVPGQGAGAWH
jgi:hypothetical protein